MHCAQVFTALLGFVASISAATLPETVHLDNGESTVSAAVGKLAERGLIEARNPCSGSGLCTNMKRFRDLCDTTVGLVKDTIYRNGGARSGVCAKAPTIEGCGLFIQGQWIDSNGNKQDCTANKNDMVTAYHMIRRNGCLACGWVTAPNQGSECRIKIDYVTGC